MRRDAARARSYTIPMGLCYVRGFGALTVALAGGLPGDYGPWGLWGMNQQESVAGPAGHSLLTLLPFIARSAGAERPRVCDWSALARKEQSRSGAKPSERSFSGVKRA